MSWTYEEIKEKGIDIEELMCKCGHNGQEHHIVYWPLGIGIDECEAYGFNESGGMMAVHDDGETCEMVWKDCKEKHTWTDHCQRFEEAE